MLKSFRRGKKKNSATRFWALKILSLLFGEKGVLPFFFWRSHPSLAGFFCDTEQYENTHEHPRMSELDLRCGNPEAERGRDLAKTTFRVTAEPRQELVSRKRERMPVCRRGGWLHLESFKHQDGDGNKLATPHRGRVQAEERVQKRGGSGEARPVTWADDLPVPGTVLGALQTLSRLIFKKFYGVNRFFFPWKKKRRLGEIK